MTADEWTDADPSGLRAAWRDDADLCDRCPAEAEHVLKDEGEKRRFCDLCYRDFIDTKG